MEPTIGDLTRAEIEALQRANNAGGITHTLCTMALRALDADAELARRDAARVAIRKRHEDYTPGMLLAALEATEAALRESERRALDAAAATRDARAAKGTGDGGGVVGWNSATMEWYVLPRGVLSGDVATAAIGVLEFFRELRMWHLANAAEAASAEMRERAARKCDAAAGAMRRTAAGFDLAAIYEEMAAEIRAMPLNGGDR